jgi:hypothetical protein
METDAIDITDASQETADQAAVKQLPVFRNSVTSGMHIWAL